MKPHGRQLRDKKQVGSDRFVSLQREPPTTSDHADSIMSRTSKALTAQETVHGTRHPNAESIPYLLALKQLFKNYQFFPVIFMHIQCVYCQSTLCDVYNGTMYYSLPFVSRISAAHFAVSSLSQLSYSRMKHLVNLTIVATKIYSSVFSFN